MQTAHDGFLTKFKLNCHEKDPTTSNNNRPVSLMFELIMMPSKILTNLKNFQTSSTLQSSPFPKNRVKYLCRMTLRLQLNSHKLHLTQAAGGSRSRLWNCSYATGGRTMRRCARATPRSHPPAPTSAMAWRGMRPNQV